MYEAKLEFLKGWGIIGQIPFVWGYGYFLEPHIAGFSIRIKVGGRNIEVGGEGVTRAVGATF